MPNMLLQLVGRLLPPGLAVLALLLGGPQVNMQPTLQNILLSAIFGFAVSLWLSAFKMERTTDKTANDIGKSASLNICVVSDKAEIEAIVKGMYQTDGGVLYSTSINYTPEDINVSDSRKTDWAGQLYSKRDTRTVFNRIVSVYSDRDREWVGNMLKAKRNQNYDLRIVEGVPSPILFPNFVIVRKNDEYRVFMSFRAHSSEGRFAFVTQDRRFAEGIWQYATRFHSSLPKAETCVAQWERDKKDRTTP